MGFTKKSPMWYEVIKREEREDGTLWVDVQVPRGSAWFDGHFPGHPVLPGIAQLGMVFDLIRNAMAGPVRVTEVSRVRFKQMILPEDRLIVVAEPRSTGNGAYGFRITKDDEVVCSGTMTVAVVQPPITIE